MTEVVIRSGTRDELAGVTVGSGNVWVRPGYDGVSVELVLPERSVVLAPGDHVDLGGRRCTLVRIEPVPAGGAHHLHFRTEPVTPPPSTGSSAMTPAPSDDAEPATGSGQGGRPAGDEVRGIDVTLAPAHRGNAATALRRASGALLELLGATEAPTADRWSRTELEEWVEIDHVPCGPNTTTTWTWAEPHGSGAGDRSDRAEVCEVVVRWNVDEVHEQRLSGAWRSGSERLLISLAGAGPEHHLRVTGPPVVVDRALAVALAELGARPPGVARP